MRHIDIEVLSAIEILDANAYGATIWRLVNARSGKSYSIGAIYASLNRLENGGHIRSWEGEATSERGWRPKRYYSIVKKAQCKQLKRSYENET